MAARRWDETGFEGLLRGERGPVCRYLAELQELSEVHRSRYGLDSYRQSRIYDQACESLLRGKPPAIRRCRGPECLWSFTAAHVRRIAISELRHAKAEGLRFVEDLEALDRSEKPIPPAARRRMRIQGEICALLLFVSAALSEMEVEVAKLHYGRGLVLSEVAALLQKPLGCIKQANTRARTKLQRWAAEHAGLELELNGERRRVGEAKPSRLRTAAGSRA